MADSFPICKVYSRRKETLTVILPSITVDDSEDEEYYNVVMEAPSKRSIGSPPVLSHIQTDFLEMEALSAPAMSPILRETLNTAILTPVELITPPNISSPAFPEPKHPLYSPVKYQLPEVKKPRAGQHKSSYISVGGAKVAYSPDSFPIKESKPSKCPSEKNFDLKSVFPEPKHIQKRYVEQYPLHLQQLTVSVHKTHFETRLLGSFDEPGTNKLRQKRSVVRVQSLVPIDPI
jgi:hypothetical protein